MKSYLLQRLLWGAATLAGAVTLVFFLGRAIPGDPVDVMLGENAPAAKRHELRQQLNLDKPPAKQYVLFLKGLVSADLGRSIRSGKPVSEELASALPLTLTLGGAAFMLSCLLAFPLGLAAAWRPGSTWDQASRLLSTGGLAMPSFFLGPVLILALAVIWPIFPISGSDEPFAIVLPAFTLALPLAAALSRIVRVSVIEEAGRDYVRTGMSKGLSRWRVFAVHIMRNAMLPVITTLGLQFGAVLTGAIITEKVFRWPGLGTLVLTSIGSRDYPVVQGVVIVFSATYIAVNLLTDIAYSWADPRVELAGQG